MWQLPVRQPSRCAAWPVLWCDTVWFGVSPARTARELCDTLTTTPLSYSTGSLPSSALWNHSTVLIKFLLGLKQHSSLFTKYTVVALRDRGEDQCHRNLWTVWQVWANGEYRSVTRFCYGLFHILQNNTTKKKQHYKHICTKSSFYMLSPPLAYFFPNAMPRFIKPMTSRMPS